MKRILTAALLLAFAAPLAGCGISGGLKTPPPIWGDAKTDVAADDATEADDSSTTTVSDNPLDTPVDERAGYGVDVADTP